MNLLRRFATEATRREAEQLSADLEIARRTLAVVEVERDELAAVVARNIARVKAESAAAARSRAQSEGNQL
jgi:hypothetical protein